MDCACNVTFLESIIWFDGNFTGKKSRQHQAVMCQTFSSYDSWSKIDDAIKILEGNNMSEKISFTFLVCISEYILRENVWFNYWFTFLFYLLKLKCIRNSTLFREKQAGIYWLTHNGNENNNHVNKWLYTW